jgi:hypothetical protein
MLLEMKTPSSWQDVTLGQFMELRDLNNEGLDGFDLTNAQIAVLCGLTQQDVLKLDAATRYRITERLQFIDTEPTGEFSNRFWHNGKRWAVTDRIVKLTAGQYIDICHYIKTGVNANYHKVLGVICDPLRFGMFKRSGGYDSDRATANADELLTLPVPVAMAIAAFFLNSLEIFMDNIPTYLAETVKVTSSRSGSGGTSSSTT